MHRQRLGPVRGLAQVGPGSQEHATGMTFVYYLGYNYHLIREIPISVSQLIINISGIL